MMGADVTVDRNDRHLERGVITESKGNDGRLLSRVIKVAFTRCIDIAIIISHSALHKARTEFLHGFHAAGRAALVLSPDIIRMILSAPLSKSPHLTIHQDVYVFPQAASLAAPFPILSSRKVAFSTSARKTTGNAADSSEGNHSFGILARLGGT